MTIPQNPSGPRHGGNLAYATARYGTPPEGWLDLSTGINPHPYPATPVKAEDLAALPDRAALDRLLVTARQAYRVPFGVHLLATPGSEIAIRLLPFLLPDRPTAIVGPTYGSHYDAWAEAQRTVATVDALEAIPVDVANVVVTNPNNPDGRTFGLGTLEKMANECAQRGGALIVDEAFADLEPDYSLTPLLGDTPAVVLRSFGKFFGLAGLRLGFVATSFPPAAQIERLLGDWPVSATALGVGQTALADDSWQTKARHHLGADAARLRTLFERHGLTVAGGTDLFALVDHDNATGLHIRLAEAGIWTRVFPYRRDWIRFGLPGSPAAFERLDRALAAAADLI